MPPRPGPPRPARRLLFTVLAVFVALGLLARVTDRDPTGRAVGLRGCAAEDDPDARAALVDELDALLVERAAWVLPAPPQDGDWSAFPAAPGNPLSDAKVELGRQLFFEPGLVTFDFVGPQTASCATCHDPAASFGSGTSVGRGIGAGGEGRGATRALRADAQVLGEADFGHWSERRLVNGAWTASVAGWMGDFDAARGYGPEPSAYADGLEGLEAFVAAALRAHGIYDRRSEFPPDESVMHEPSYALLFEAAYPELRTHKDRTTRRQVALALSAYVRAITTWDAPFQRFLRLDPTADPADVPLSTQALRGAVVFFGDGRCRTCHSGPALASATFATLGTRYSDPHQELLGFRTDAPTGENGWGTVGEYMGPTAVNLGRFLVSGDEADRGAFLVPSVYGAGSPGVLAWGHGGAHGSLADFLVHKVGGNDPARNPTLDRSLLPNLSAVLFTSADSFLDDAQITDLVAFIEEGLEDEGLAARHAPAGNRSRAGYCTPSADPVSAASTPGCEAARQPVTE